MVEQFLIHTNMIIRLYKPEDFEMIQSWWTSQGEISPSKEMMPLDTSFVLEENGVPLASVCLYFTNSKEICHFANIVGSPDSKGPKRKEATQLLLEYAKLFAKEHGYKKLLCFSYKDKLKKRYEEMGWTPTLHNITSFVMNLEDK